VFRLPAIGHTCCEGYEWFADVNIFGGVVNAWRVRVNVPGLVLWVLFNQLRNRRRLSVTSFLHVCTSPARPAINS
jgi:hypothetical protein